MQSVNDLKIKIFADGADLDLIAKMRSNKLISGFTTNPTLMRSAGVSDYEGFAKSALKLVGNMPISFEVFSDEFAEMEAQAQLIASWGENIYVKIPITNTQGLSSVPLIQRLSDSGVKLNITALFTMPQIEATLSALKNSRGAVLSVFAGRIADSGVNPLPTMKAALTAIQRSNTASELLWASPREVLNVVEADQMGCHIITVTKEIISKLSNIGKDPDIFSLETVKMFYNDAKAAAYTLNTSTKKSGRVAA